MKEPQPFNAEELLLKCLKEAWQYDEIIASNTFDKKSFKAILSAINQAYQSGRNEDKWVSVSESLPEDSKLVLGLVGGTDVYVCFYKKNRNLFQVWGSNRDPINDMDVTHWQDFPSLPSIPGNKNEEK